ncbi:MAG: Na+/H+ antiporter subunit E [Thermodesulfobacteriota bacterium]
MYTAVTSLILFGSWLILSGRFDAFHLGLGLLSSLLVAALSGDLLFADRRQGFGRRLREALRFCRYALWLFWQIVLANIHVTILAFSPKALTRDIDPHLITFRTRLKSDFARFVLANSITLTPGTVAIRVHGDIFHVHAISRKAAGDLASESVSEMERRVAWVFEEGRL